MYLARTYAADDDAAMVVVVSVVVRGDGRRSSFGRLGNKVCPDEKAHVFAFSIYRNPARARS